ncbi:pyridoxamine 5'-phosphate oxidase family protein [Thalassococcus lentus]|uniref:Pyridoxamine 5'-phosphate oxidase family protein n=1 Tax=Thalassococcus lentus TaxID=1210524 RepID=A0ABT4XNL5_9RHOB|nr:pyridoxamine 5'-phosphate oxidase family protein [Thalassococcus lentus]MDA7423515.1 pyridoxamine 5'-phosphate oxidase family protein [Thalassococcus lentus]
MKTPEDLRLAAWAEIARGVEDRHHPARNPTLVTVAKAGPEARTIVLRSWDSGRSVAEFQTDRMSAKVAELEADPRAGLHFWLPEKRLQIRFRCRVELIHADRDRWARIPDVGRDVYGGTHAPGVPLEDPGDFKPLPMQERFTAVLAQVLGIDLLYLGPDRHERAVFQRDGSSWVGGWVAP